MAYNAYDELVTGHPRIKHYWTLDNTPNATIGGINLTGTTTYATGKAHAKCATFDGLSEELQTASAINLSSTSTISIAAWVKVVSWSTTTYQAIFGLSSNYTAVTDSFETALDGTAAGDPLTVALKGDGGFNAKRYTKAGTGAVLDDGAFHFAVITYDKTLAGAAGGECALYVDGVLVSDDGTPLTSDNTNAFGNRVFYIASRGGASFFSNVAIDGLAIFDTILTQSEIERLNASVVGTMPAVARQNLDLQPILKVG